MFQNTTRLSDPPENGARGYIKKFDADGDTYLDRREFTAARRGETFDS